ADPRLIAVLRNCQAPYPLPAPCVRLALQALQPDALRRTRARVTETIEERERLYRVLQASPALRRAYPSQGNFLLARFIDADAALQSLLAAGIVVRDMRSQPQLGDALRISIGTREENDAVLAALAKERVAA
ncbi:MAG: aminotransferase class I/II-fold pyridoxal phosphate-dependent enzyme, partial [Luteimonas sp.]